MYYDNEQRLFSEADLGSHLRGLGERLHSHVQKVPLGHIQTVDEGILVNELVDIFSLEAPVLLENEMKVDPREADITVRGGFSRVFDEDQTYTTKGLAIDVKIPFRGHGALFYCRPSTFSASGTPAAIIHDGELVLSYETTEKDPEIIKQRWERDVSQIQQYLEWVAMDVSNYNIALEENARIAIAKRKQEALQNQSLIDSIKKA